MKTFLIPSALALIGLAGGVGAGLATKPHTDEAAQGDMTATPPDAAKTPRDYVKLNNQFVVPVIEKGVVAGMVILSLGLEVDVGSSEQVYTREPKLRDAFLQVLFDHANSGGFGGMFTEGSNLVLLRRALLEAASGILGSTVSDVLISDLVRQDS